MNGVRGEARIYEPSNITMGKRREERNAVRSACPGSSAFFYPAKFPGYTHVAGAFREKRQGKKGLFRERKVRGREAFFEK